MAFLSFFLFLLPLLTSSSLPPQISPHQSLAPILSNLGFEELALSLPALYSPILSSWSGPITLFAPSHLSPPSSFRSLRDHIVPGLFPHSYLSKLPHPTKLETASPNRCLTLTSPDQSKVFVENVEITDPDLFNDGHFVVHGIRHFVPPLSPASCAPDIFPEIDDRKTPGIMRLMLRDAMLRLRDGGYDVLSIAMKVKYGDLAGLSNMTVFALDDRSIFAGGNGYISNVRFHIVPNRMLMSRDLMRMRNGAVLPTMARGQHLVVTKGGRMFGGVRINYVPVKEFDVVYNARIVVHRVLLPFPHLYLANGGMDTPESEMFERKSGGIGSTVSEIEMCEDLDGVGTGECYSTPAEAPAGWEGADFDEGF